MARDSQTELEREAASRLGDCRKRKGEVETDLREAYFFTAPRRSREVNSATGNVDRTRPSDQGELNISLGIEAAQDFATEMLNTFMPEVMEWAQQTKGAELDEDTWENAKDDVEGQTTDIMRAIKSSNFYAAAAQAFMPDLALGTIAMWIDDPRPSEPLMCQPVPLRELELNVGPFGEVDDRWIVQPTRYRYLRAKLGDIDLPKDIQERVRNSPNARCIVSWGWWRLWEKTNDIWWQAVVRVGEKVVWSGELRGEGSCPLVIGRFNVDPAFPFGDGPTIQALPELRRLDETELLKMENADFQIHPPFAYPDDGTVNLAGGIEPGMGYPSRPGSGKDFVKLSFEGNVNFAEFETLRIESRIKRLHFVDYPEQSGKTPPTAEQWSDEMMRAKRRIGTPGKIFFREFCAGVFLRFKYLLEKRGIIRPVQVNGKTISLIPYDPTEQAQEYQEVSVAMRVLEAARNFFPQTAALTIDDAKTLTNIQKKLRDTIVVLRDPEQIKAAAALYASTLGQPSGPAPDGTMPGPPAAP
jgi:hypothetical protein